MASFQDQLTRNIALPATPRRIISLVPSQTELLYDLGLEEEVAGITKFCIHPEKWFHHKTRVGGTKNIHLDIIRDLQPDLIIANKEENEKEQLESLMDEFPVWVSDIHHLQDALDMIKTVGEITGKKEKAIQLAGQIETRFKTPTPEIINRKLKAAYFIWHNPWMVAGGDTFINEMMKYCGLENCFAHLSRYPVVNLRQLQVEKCELILLSSEPFPFREKHAEEIRNVFPRMNILLVDGEMFSWYGSRLLKAADYFRQIFIQ